MTITRRKLWADKVGRCNQTMPLLSSLSPTQEAFTENVKRAHLQTCIWRNALDGDPPNIDPCGIGWQNVSLNEKLVAVTVPQGVTLAPPEILKIIRCKFSSDSRCMTQICTWSQAKLPCIMFCLCAEQCCNEQTVI